MLLTDEEKRMCGGEYGTGVQKAMDLLVKWGDVFDAKRMVKINWAHVDLDITPHDFFFPITEGANPGPKVTVHPTNRPERLKELGITPEPLADKLIKWHKQRLEVAKGLEWYITSSCAEYLMGFVPRKSDVIAMTGVCMQVTNNSLFGALVTRGGDFAALASAVTGRTPMMGLMLLENRYAHVLVELDDLDVNSLTEADYSAIGYYIGANVAGFKNVVVNGLPRHLPFEYLRALVIPLPMAGAVTLCHVVGLTPEAETVEQALGGRKPEQVIMVGRRNIKEVWEQLNKYESDNVEHVVIGCPHCTIEQIKKIARLIGDKKLKTSLLVAASAPMYALAKVMGYTDIIEKAGGVFLDTCASLGNPYVNPYFSAERAVKSVATNAAGGVRFMTSLGNIDTFFGTEEECIDAAITGKWRGKPKWK